MIFIMHDKNHGQWNSVYHLIITNCSSEIVSGQLRNHNQDHTRGDFDLDQFDHNTMIKYDFSDWSDASAPTRHNQVSLKSVNLRRIYRMIALA